LLPQPSKHIEAVQSRHFQIQKDQVRHRISLSVGKPVVALQIVDQLLAVSDEVQAAWNPGFCKFAFQKESVFGVVFRN